jgi:hypothetical protein
MKFAASEAGFEADEYALVCGVYGESQYLTFQRDAEDSDDDWGVQLQYGDQSNGSYDCVRDCHLARNETVIL